jgi:hypothetical protein
MAAATLSLPGGAGAPAGASTVVPLSVDDASGLLGTDILILYDPAVAVATSVAAAPLAAGQALTYNLSPPGVVRISLYGAVSLSGAGPLVDISFTSVGEPGSRTSLDVVSGDLNEGAIAAALLDGDYCVQGLPAEVENLRLQPVTGSTAAVLSWDPHPFATSSNVYRGTRVDLADLACFASGVPAASLQDDAAVPPAGGILVHLVTAATCAGESSAGPDSSGAERPIPAPCP